MTSVINTNIYSLNAQRNLGKTQDALATSLQRLSSGLRINSAKDDAAGLAISNRFTAQINGLNQAARNANDAISLAQTGEGALEEVTNNLQRIRELAVQAVNATNTPGDRAKIQNEIAALSQELDRIATTAEFNGQKLFDGSFGTATFQVGANANQTISASVTNLRTNQYGDYQILGLASAGAATTRLVAGQDIVVNGSITSGTYTTQAGDTAKSIAEGINKLNTGVEASARTELDISFSAAGSYTLTVQSDNATVKTIGFSINAATGTSDLQAAAKAFNDAAGVTGVTAIVNDAGTGITLLNATGNDIVLGDTTTANSGAVTVDGATLAADATADTAVINGQVTLDSSTSFTAADSGSGFGVAAAASTLLSVSTLDVSTPSNATTAIKIVDAALSTVDDQRSAFGALQNRFTSTINSLQTSAENLSAARSRIRDADFARETANLTRNQILQQAGTAILAQANSIQQSVLALLR
ncbi:MAG: flagellin N-terminal helical domain-containing protein [Gammaproteobacteria bacterium]